MSTRLRDLFGIALGDLRHEPTTKRVRAQLDGVTVVDSYRAVLVWEPRRVVPTYAVPAEDIDAELVAAPASVPEEDGAPVGFAIPDVTDLPVLDPRIPFAVRSTEGDPVLVDVPATDRTVAAFRPGDPDLAGYVVLDFDGFDTWLEEDDEIVGHPTDPFHRIDVRGSSRHVQVMLDGQLLADTRRARMLFETMLPPRYYVPIGDVRVGVQQTATRTYCAYKGLASYWSVDVAGHVVRDLLWGYHDPLQDASTLVGYVSFFDERIDLVIDGAPRPRPVTPWS